MIEQQFSVSERAAFLDLNPAIGIVDNVETPAEYPSDLTAIVDSTTAFVSEHHQSLLTRPCVQGYRSLFAKIGYPDQLPAGERLVETFMKNGFRSFGPVIDAYNIVALKNFAGIGAHDASKIRGRIDITLADGHETIMPIFKDKRKKVKQGDMVYKDDGETIAWLGKRDVDSDIYKISDTTKDIVFVILGNENTTYQQNEETLDEIFGNIKIFSPHSSLRILKGS